jgi:TonB family protein
MTASTAARPAIFSDSFGPTGWGFSLLLVLLIHLAVAYYVLVYRRIVVQEPTTTQTLLIDLPPVAPVLGPKIAPQTQPKPVPAPAKPAVPAPQQFVAPPPTAAASLAPQPMPKLETSPLPNLPKPSPDEVAALPQSPKTQEPASEVPPAEFAPLPMLRPNITRPQAAKPAIPRVPAGPVQSQNHLPLRKPPNSPSSGAMERANPITLWQAAVVAKVEPYKRWPPDAPYWVNEASPVIQVTINRQGTVLSSKIVGTSGYEAFDNAARKLFKRAISLPAPPPEMPGNPLSFTMSVTFSYVRQSQ